MTKRPVVLIDGSNFYHGVKRCWPYFHTSNLDYINFARILTSHQNPEVIYYVGEIKRDISNAKTEALYSQQQAVFYNLEQMGIEIKKGFILQNGNNYTEKGVDVQIAVDLAVGAVKSRYDAAYLVSSDSDLVPAVKVATQESKKVVYVAFEKFRSIALAVCSSQTYYVRFPTLKKAGTVNFKP